MNQTALHVGAGRADVTPAMGIQIAGNIGKPQPVCKVRNRLYVDVAAIRRDGRTIVLISAPPTNILRTQADPIRRDVAAIFDTPPDAVVMHVTQSHSSPAVGHNIIFEHSAHIPDDMFWLRGGDPRYIEPFHQGVLAAAHAARGAMQPATARACRTTDGRIAFNRRFVMRDGTAGMHPGYCNPNVLCAEGPADPEVGIVIFEALDGKAITALLHFTSHPGHGWAQDWVDPDWPGAWGDAVRARLGAQCIPLALNGFCGNIHHQNHQHPTQHLTDTIENMTVLLMEATDRAMKELRPLDVSRVDFVSRRVPIAWRDIPEEEIRNAQATLARDPQPPMTDGQVPWDWIRAIGALQFAELRRASDAYDWEIQIVRVGDLAIVACPGEPFVESQLEIKKAPPVPFVFCAHASNDAAGYLPTLKAYEGGGYESVNRFRPGGLEEMTRHAKAMLTHLCSTNP